MYTNAKPPARIALVLIITTLALGALATSAFGQPVQDQQHVEREVAGSGDVGSSTDIDHGLQTTTVSDDGEVTRSVERRGDARQAGSHEQTRVRDARDTSVNTNTNTHNARDSDTEVQRTGTGSRTGGANGTGRPAFSQTASAQGQDAGIAQNLFVMVDRVLGTDLAIQMNQESSATGGPNNTVASTQNIQFGAAQPADIGVRQQSTAVGSQTAVDQQYRVNVDGTTYQSRQASHGSGQTSLGQQLDTRKVRAGGQQTTGTTTTTTGGVDRRTRSVAHNHAHGPGVHHGQQHRGSHTHRHQHQQTTTGTAGAHQQPVQQPTQQPSQQQPVHQGQQQPQGQAVHGPSQAGPGGCYTHTHKHGWGTHHGEFHIGTHTHAHQHCPDGASDTTGTVHGQSGDGTGAAGADCRHRHYHGQGMHHGEDHIVRHIHYHNHC